MIPDTPSINQLAHVISQAAAPAFLLGALAAFIALLINRLNRIVDRTVVLNGIPDHDSARVRLKADLPRLMQRAAMMNRAVFWAVVASIAVTLLIIVAFVTAFFQLRHEYGVAIFFLISLSAFTASLIDFAREVRIALSEYDHHA
ncbi:putative membrane protein YgcG [Bradyrhizobium algeriense]|uniref:Membrane protein YgcG n=1 Tax=Bradyrhizobium algeriense TaxID=634784 RepID=A0ABU8B5L7_9BRAD